MAPKVFPFNFESFEGLDYRTTGLKSSILTAQNLQNFQFGESYSIRGRPGSQLIALPGGFLGVCKFNYNDLATNTPTEELIAINDVLWKLTVFTQEIVRSAGSATWGYRFYLDFENEFRFEITESGTPITLAGLSYVHLGTGLSQAPVTIMDLCETIDAHANYSVTTTFEKARVNGSQTGVNTITVDAGHTYAANDEIEFFDFASMKLVSRLVTATAANSVTVNGPVVNVVNDQVLGAVAATPAACVPINTASEATGTSQTFLFYYWTRVRHTVSDTMSIGTSYTPFQNFFSGNNSSNYINPCFVPTDTNLHTFTEVSGTTIYEWENRPFKYDGKVSFRSGLHRPYFSDAAIGAAGVLTGSYKWKVQYEMRDAQGYIHLSQPSQFFPGEEITLAAEQGDVTIYQVQTDFGTEEFNDIDKLGRLNVTASVNGNQVGVTTIVTLAQNSFVANDTIYFLDRSTTTYVMRRVTAVTQLAITIDGTAVNVNNGDILYHGYVGYNIKYAQVNGNQNNVSTVTVDTGHGFKAGDSIFIRGNDGAGAIKYHDIVLSSVTTTTLVWDANKYGTVYVRDNEIVSCGLKINVYRTKAGGSVFYRTDTLTNNPTAPFVTFSDNKADTALGEELIEPEIGKEWNPPPRASIATIHQGVMIYSRVRGDGNNVGFSDSVGGLEAVPLASNYFSVPGSVNGIITGVASDDADSLLVTKERALYRTDGALESNSFNVLTIREGDYGISSHSSIVKINGALVGVGPLGFIAILGGQLLTGDKGGSLFGFRINPAIIGNDNLRLTQAISFNDSLNRHYQCFIPDVAGYASGKSNSNSFFFVCDYEKNNVWFNNAYQDACLIPAGGFTQAAIGPVNYLLYTGGSNPNYYIPHVYHLSRNFDSALGAADNQIPGCLFREMSAQYGEANRYFDHYLRIIYTWLTKDETLQDPENEKEFSRVKVWSLPGNYETRPAFSLTVKSYKDFQATTLDSQITMSFPTTIKQNSKELALNKCQGMAFEFTASTNASNGGPFISGISLTASLPYRKEDIKK